MIYGILLLCLICFGFGWAVGHGTVEQLKKQVAWERERREKAERSLPPPLPPQLFVRLEDTSPPLARGQDVRKGLASLSETEQRVRDAKA
jgi:hypothetical protein